MDLKARTVLLVNKKAYESSTEKTAQQKKISKKAGRSFTWNLYRTKQPFFWDGKKYLSKKSPTGPTEWTPKLEYLVALVPSLGVRLMESCLMIETSKSFNFGFQFSFVGSHAEF